jgi:monoamine oxidase
MLRREFLESLLTATSLSGLAALPASPKPTPVIVLGAGLAGMVAALELHTAGLHVTVLEANGRPGGRVHTLREPFSDSLYAEAGAGRIPSTHDLTLRYVKEFKLPLAPFYPVSGAEVFFIKGQRSVVDTTHPLDMSRVALALTDQEHTLGLEKLQGYYVGEAAREVGRVPAKDWPSPAVLKKYGSISIHEFLKSRGASKDAIELLVTGYQSEAALDFLRDLSSHQAPRLSKIVGGNDLLPRAFAMRLSRNITYGARVTRLEQNESGVRVSFSQGGLNNTLEAAYLICAIPFSVLRTIEISPAFSSAKQTAIRSTTYGSVSRVYLQTKNKFWQRAGLSGFAQVDREMEFWNPTWNQPGERGLLMAYAYEHLAREIAMQAAEERVMKMRDYFDQVLPGTKREFELGTSWVWEEQPFSRGAYCVYQPGQLDTLLPAAMRSEKRILFAGEHCSSHPGWMQGALESGLRAARTLQNAAM